LEITFLGHSAFRLRGRDVTVVTDPYPPASSFAMGKVAADIVTVSHKSPHHCYVEGVGNEPRVVNGPGEYEIADVLIHGVATSTEPGNGAVNTAYVLRFDDLTVCHLGDVRDKLSDKQVEDIGSIDVLLVPVGGGRALTPTRAAEVVHQLGPSVVIPMHYRLNGGPVPELDPVDAFCREMGSKEWNAEPKLSLTRSSLPAEPRLVVLENKPI
jgi:L-ascorbate metabolism protein UlaG (beta-lactamase superfamily)